MMIICIGGSLDGKEVPRRGVTFKTEKESYILIQAKEDKVMHRFYMACGMTPAAAMEIYRRFFKKVP